MMQIYNFIVASFNVCMYPDVQIRLQLIYNFTFFSLGNVVLCKLNDHHNNYVVGIK